MPRGGVLPRSPFDRLPGGTPQVAPSVPHPEGSGPGETGGSSSMAPRKASPPANRRLHRCSVPKDATPAEPVARRRPAPKGVAPANRWPLRAGRCRWYRTEAPIRRRRPEKTGAFPTSRPEGSDAENRWFVRVPGPPQVSWGEQERCCVLRYVAHCDARPESGQEVNGKTQAYPQNFFDVPSFDTASSTVHPRSSTGFPHRRPQQVPA